MPEFRFGVPKSNTQAQAQEMRDNFDSLATTNVTSDSLLPRNPRNGMLRVLSADTTNIMLQLFWGTWRTIFQNINEDASQVRRKEKSFSTSLEWVFDHNLNTYPIVQAVDASGHVLFPEDIEHASNNRVIIKHSTAQTGKIIVVG